LRCDFWPVSYIITEGAATAGQSLVLLAWSGFQPNSVLPFYPMLLCFLGMCTLGSQKQRSQPRSLIADIKKNVGLKMAPWNDYIA
jgi:hypothetical protein